MRGGNLMFVLGVVGVVAAVALAYRFLLVDPAVAPPTAVVTPPPASAATLLSMRGTVEVQQGDAAWKAAAAGETPLLPGAQVRTGSDGEAALKYGDDVQMQLNADSHVGVEASGSSVVRLRVIEGSVTADVHAKEGRVVEFMGADDEAKVVTRDGRVHVATDAAGQLQAAVSRGSADVTAKGSTVRVGAGQQTLVPHGEAPQAPSAIPASLLLQVTWPVAGPTAKRRHRIEGTTAPLARVRIGDQRVMADRHGHFSAVVELAEGKNAIHIIATDVTGRTQEQSSPDLLLDTRAPMNSVETDPNMWQPAAAPH